MYLSSIYITFTSLQVYVPVLANYKVYLLLCGALSSEITWDTILTPYPSSTYTCSSHWGMSCVPLNTDNIRMELAILKLGIYNYLLCITASSSLQANKNVQFVLNQLGYLIILSSLSPSLSLPSCLPVKICRLVALTTFCCKRTKNTEQRKTGKQSLLKKKMA